MSNGSDYQKPCKNCKKFITMSKRSGKWSAYEGDNSLHKCQERQPKITEQEASHPEPVVLEAQELEQIKYPKHRVKFIVETPAVIQDRINAALEENDSRGYIHKGVTLIYNEDANEYAALIHYEIPLPRDQRGFSK